MDLLTANDRIGEYPGSFYAGVTEHLAPFPPAEGEITCDVCVVGGGFTGLSSAMHLAQRGYSVRLVEAQRVGFGASGRNGGQVGQGQRLEQDELEEMVGLDHARELWRIGMQSVELVRELAASDGINTPFYPGIVHADHRERYVEHSRKYVDHLHERYGYEHIRFLDRDEIREHVRSDGYFGGTLDTRSGHINPLAFVLGLARMAASVGAVIHERSRVTDIAQGSKPVVTTETARITADHVILACNGYLGELQGDVANRVMPINNYIVATEPLGPERQEELIRGNIAVADSRFVVNYFRFSEDHRLLFGGTESYDWKFPADIGAMVRRPLSQIFPQLADVRFDHAWGGTLGITMNRMPHYATYGGNIISMSGFSGHGVAMGTLSGQIAAEMISGQAERFDIMARVPSPRFPGGVKLRRPLLVLAMLWYSLRDRIQSAWKIIMSGDDIAAFMAEHPQLRSVTVAVCDVNGAFRGKRLPAAQVEKIAEGGFRMPLSAVTLDIWGRDIVGSALVFASGDADGVCSMTGRGVLLSTWLSEPTAMIPVWMNREDGSPFPIDPRRALAMVLDRYTAHGLRPVVATELEFYLTEPGGERPRRPKSPTTGERLHSDEILSVAELDGFSGFLDDVYAACAIQDIPVDSAISEGGAGQFEINLLHTDDPLKAADDSVLFKRLVRGVARKHGFAATFMAKPFGDAAGNGMHVHFSVLDQDGNNIFDNGEPEGSQALLHAVGGLLATMHENTLVFAPHQNSYRRISPGSHAPTGASWGYENRTAAIRIPGGDHRARRIEHRLAGADVNPYLSMAAILGGALLGMEQKIEPSEPLTGNAYEADIPPLPLDWPSAIAAFEEGEYVAQIFDPKLQQLFAQTKQQELKRFSETVTRFEYQTYLEVV